MIISNNYKDFLYILRCTARNEIVNKDNLYEKNVAELFKIAKKHSLEAFLYPTVKKVFASEYEIINEWKIACDREFRKHILFSNQRNEVISRLEQEKIWYVILKGALISNYYPKPYERQMTDNDILFDVNSREKVKDIMLGLDFQIKKYYGEIDDVYYKKPIFNFEMHRKLSVIDVLDGYFSDITSRLISIDNRHEKILSPEDFYIYVLAHELKHYDKGGIGIRYLLDWYFYKKNAEVSCDMKKIDAILENAGLLNFKNEREDLVDALFGDSFNNFKSCLDSVMLGKYCTSGVHGNSIQRINNNLEKISGKNKLGRLINYYKNVFIIPDSILKEYYPVVYKHKYLRPFFYTFKLFRALFKAEKWRELFFILNKIKK